ncbi:MAG TPA: DUF309 domain-containing protein [Thermoanaerobaculia bacterium]|nr:DUF309 domain-containing protein [Thermoanaerobaculia bacterium]HUM29811.1 DUF309 domain-containing protein [Thermoanaerobaculia bacterium]HXK68086.1 DUF309 domain-containing protein [Thermoanaerobaculia bacterium]
MRRKDSREQDSRNPSYPDSFVRGVNLYHRADYWCSHEAFEELWLGSAEPERTFSKAMVQLNAALFHAGRKKWNSVIRLLTRVSAYLESMPQDVLGISTAELKVSVDKLKEGAIEARAGKRAFPWQRKPVLHPPGIVLHGRRRLRPMDGPKSTAPRWRHGSPSSSLPHHGKTPFK